MRFPSTSPGRTSGGSGGTGDTSSDDDDTINLADELEEARREDDSDPEPEPEPEPTDSTDTSTGSSSGTELVQGPTGGGSDPDPEPDPEPDPAPPSDSTGGAVSPADDTESAADDYSDENRLPPEDTDGGTATPSDAVEDAAENSDPQVSPPDPAPVDEPGPSDSEPDPEPGSPGDIDFRFADQSDAVDSDPDFRTDTPGRGVAEGLLASGRDVGDAVGGGVADVIGADQADREVLQSFAGAGASVPGSVAFIGADAADAGRFITEPARDAVEPGAQLGADDLGDIGSETATRTGEIGAAAGDAAIEGADTVLDIDFERRADGEGAAISFTDDPEVRNDLAGELAFGAASLGAAGPASSATRTAAGAASRGARSAADSASSRARGAADAVDLDEFIDDTRGARQTGRQRDPADRGTDDVDIGADEIDPRNDQTGEIARQQYEQTIYEQEQRFGDIERESVPEAPRDTTNVRDSGSDIGGGIGGRGSPEPADGVGSFADNFDASIRASNTDPQLTDLRDTVDGADLDGATGTGGAGSAAGGAGAGSLGTLDSANDPTGIGDTGSAAGETVTVDEITGAGTDTTGTDTLDPTNDPTAIDPGTLDQFGGPIGGGTLPGDATGGGSDVGTLDEANDPTNVAPPDLTTDTATDSGTDVFVEPGPATDTGTEPGTDTPPATDTGTDLDPGQTTPPVDTPAPPRTDTPAPPRTDTPARTPDPTPRPTPRPTPDRGRPRRAPEIPDPDDEERDELNFGTVRGVDETFENPTRGLGEVDDDLADGLDLDF